VGVTVVGQGGCELLSMGSLLSFIEEWRRKGTVRGGKEMDKESFICMRADEQDKRQEILELSLREAGIPLINLLGMEVWRKPLE